MAEAPPTDVLLGIQLARFWDVLKILGVSPKAPCYELRTKLQEFTAESHLSFCEHVKEFDQNSPLGKHVSLPTVFVSYSMTYSVGEVVGCLLDQCERDDYIWFDLFSTPTRGTFRPWQWWRNTFFSNVKAIGRMILIMKPADLPSILTRTWPLFELWAAVQGNCRTQFSFVSDGDIKFLERVRTEWRRFHQGVSELSVVNSETADPDDKQRVLEVAEERGGHEEMDAAIRAVLMQWFDTLVSDHRSKAAIEEERLAYTHVLGGLRVEQKEYPVGGELLQEALAGRRRVLGETHEDTLATMQSVGHLCFMQGMNEACERLWAPYARERERLMAGSDFVQVDVMDVLEGLATVYEEQGRPDEAEAMLRAYLEVAGRVCGAGGPRRLTALNNLGLMLDTAGRRGEAEALYQECWRGLAGAVGEGHVDTVLAQYNLARCYYNQGKLQEAEEAYKECLGKYRTALGPDHPDTIRTMANLATLYDNQGRCGEAEELYVVCWEGRGRVLGSDHKETLQTLSQLNGMRVQQGRFEAAMPALQDCLQRQRRVLAEDDEAVRQTELWLERAERGKREREERAERKRREEEERRVAEVDATQEAIDSKACRCVLL